MHKYLNLIVNAQITITILYKERQCKRKIVQLLDQWFNDRIKYSKSKFETKVENNGEDEWMVIVENALLWKETMQVLFNFK